MYKLLIALFIVMTLIPVVNNGYAQTKELTHVSKVWISDNGDGSYKNPVLHADYSDPDVIRVGSDYYMTSSSFEDIPGLPILHSKDMINWRIIGHALLRQPPFEHFSIPRHGEGVWAPSLRFHQGEFYLYYPDPDFGIYLVKSKNASGPWSDPLLIAEGKGLIDPCPLWDDDGSIYLVHAFAGSRAGIKSVLAIRELNSEGNKSITESKIIYDGHKDDPTIEGPKIHKRNGWYYIFAPAGGVPTGWQTVLRSKKIYGPYERKVVMDQGSTKINGPHQGAWVNTPSGEDWFFHFQDKEAYGRVVHLQPMKWVNGWPVIGTDNDGDGKGEPLLTYRKPDVGKTFPVTAPAESDEFNGSLGRQWQWQSNPKPAWAFINTANNSLRLYSHLLDNSKNLWDAGNILLQKFPAEVFTATTKLTFTPNVKLVGEKAGLAVMGLSYANLAVKSNADGLHLVHGVCLQADKGKKEDEKIIATLNGSTLYLRVSVTAGAKCRFSYSVDGVSFINAGEEFTAQPGKWKGAKVGLFCVRNAVTNDSGYADFDWFRIE